MQLRRVTRKVGYATLRGFPSPRWHYGYQVTLRSFFYSRFAQLFFSRTCYSSVAVNARRVGSAARSQSTIFTSSLSRVSVTNKCRWGTLRGKEERPRATTMRRIICCLQNWEHNFTCETDRPSSFICIINSRDSSNNIGEEIFYLYETLDFLWINYIY